MKMNNNSSFKSNSCIPLNSHFKHTSAEVVNVYTPTAFVETVERLRRFQKMRNIYIFTDEPNSSVVATLNFAAPLSRDTGSAKMVILNLTYSIQMMNALKVNSEIALSEKILALYSLRQNFLADTGGSLGSNVHSVKSKTIAKSIYDYNSDEVILNIFDSVSGTEEDYIKLILGRLSKSKKCVFTFQLPIFENTKPIQIKILVTPNSDNSWKMELLDIETIMAKSKSLAFKAIKAELDGSFFIV